MIEIDYQLTRSTAKGRSLRGGNEMISSNDRLCPHVKAELTAHLRALSAELMSAQLESDRLEGMEHIAYSKDNPCYMFIVISPPTKRRMDTPNWYPTVKALIDGLTDAGVFVDDNDAVIKSYMFTRGPVTSNKKYGIKLVITKDIDYGIRYITNKNN